MPATMDAWGGAVLTVLVDDVDYSCYATEVNVTRQKNRVWDPSEAGSCDIRLELSDNVVPPDVCNPGDPVVVKLGYGSVERRIFTGRVQLRQVEIRPQGDVIAINCVDEFMALSRINRRAVPTDTPVGAGENVNARILRWLTDSGTTSDITVDASSYTCPATLIDGNTLIQIQATAHADGGDFFVAGDGTLTFKSWGWQTSAISADCVFSDRNLYGWVPYTNANYVIDLDEVQNYVPGTRRVDGTVIGDTPVTQIAENTTSIGVYGTNGDALDQLELADDTQVATRAGAQVVAAAYPNPRFDSIIVNPALDPPLMWPQVIPLTYSDLVVCNRKYSSGLEISKYGHIIGELWTLNANSAQVEYRCSGTGTWDGTVAPRPPIAFVPCPDGSIRIPPGYPCNDTCNVIAKDSTGTVLQTWDPGALCTCGNVFLPEGTVEICFDCGDGLEGCTPYSETDNPILWLDANDTVADREIEKIDGDNPEIAGLTLGFAGTRLNVIDGTHDAIDASLGGGLVATAFSSHVAAAHFDGGWTVDWYLWIENDLDPTPGFMDIINLDSVVIRLHGVVGGGGPVTYLELLTISTVSGVDVGTFSGALATVPIGSWHHWRMVWDGTFLTVYMDGVIV